MLRITLFVIYRFLFRQAELVVLCGRHTRISDFGKRFGRQLKRSPSSFETDKSNITSQKIKFSTRKT